MAVSPDLMALAPWAVLAALVLLAWLSALGSPVLSFTAEILADARAMVFHRKFAQQVSKAGLLWLPAALLLTGLTAALWPSEASALATLLLARPELSAPPAATLLLFAVFSTLHAATWARLKASRGLHKLLGLLAAASGLASAWLLLSLSRLLLAGLGSETAVPFAIQDHVLIPAASPFWPLLGLALTMALVCAGGLGLAYALMRRNRDDWGRDYYGFALRFGAAWTLLLLVTTAGFLGWLAAGHVLKGALLPADPVLRAAAVTTGAALLLALAGNLIVWRSTAPLRQKPIILASCLLLLLLLAGICLAGLRILSA